MIDLVNSTQVTAEQVEEAEVRRRGSLRARHRGYLPWLKDLKTKINRKIEREGLDVKLKDAKLALKRATKEMRAGVNSEKAQTETDVSTYERDSISDRQDRRAWSEEEHRSRLLSNLRHPKAVGAPFSSERIAQFTTEIAKTNEVRDQGLTAVIQPGMPRRSVDTTTEDHRQWWLAQKEGLNMVFAASSFESMLWTREADPEARQAIYDRHLREYTESRVVEILGNQPVLDILETLANESSSEWYKLPKKLHQVLFCLHCSASGVTGPQGAHSCDGMNDSIELAGGSTERERYQVLDGTVDLRKKRPRSLKRMKRSRDPKLGVLNFKVVYAHDFINTLISSISSGPTIRSTVGDSSGSTRPHT